MITIIQDEEVLTFDQDYLGEWIDSQLTDHKLPTDIVITCYEPGGRQTDIQLTASIWRGFLVKKPGKFKDIWDTHTRDQGQRESMLTDITSKTPKFRQKCLNLINDLQNFGQNKGSRLRLEQTGHSFCLGEPYFDDKVRDKILILPFHGGTLQDALEKLEQKRIGSKICTSHDLSPIFEAALDVTWDKEQKKAVINGATKGSS